MKRIIRPLALASIASTLLFGTNSVMAQQRQRGGGQGNFDPAQFQEQMMQRYQEALGMSADEFKAVQPLIENVMAKQRELSGRGGGGFGGFGRARGGQDGQGGGQDGGRGRGFGGTPSQEMKALQDAVASGTTSEIKAKLDAFRQARQKKEAELKEAREKLRKVLTAKQEAQLVIGVGFGGALLD